MLCSNQYTVCVDNTLIIDDPYSALLKGFEDKRQGSQCCYSGKSLSNEACIASVSDVGSGCNAPSMDDHTKRAPVSDNPDIVDDKAALKNSCSLVRTVYQQDLTNPPTPTQKLAPPNSSHSVDCMGLIRDLGIPENEQALTSFWELEEGQAQVADVQGQLRQSLEFWENVLQPAPWIISCIKEGYKLPLRAIPDQYRKPNQHSALEHKDFVLEALQELVENRCIEKVQDPPHVCSPLSVVVNSQGKRRLVLNLRYLNQFLWTDKFKYEDLRVAMLMFQKNDYLFSFDLKSGYHHIDIYQPHRRYLGFSWESQGVTQFYLFAVLPFGLSTACYAFTKLLRPLVKHWRAQGLRALLYLDDGIVAVKGESAALEASQRVRADLVRAGLVEHTAKCSWVPSRKAKWLGFNLDLEQGGDLGTRGKNKSPQIAASACS